MLERFTDRARKIMALANQEAQRFNHEYIGTEHVLLGLIEEGSGVGATVLKNLNIDFNQVRLEVTKLAKSAPDNVTGGRLPQTPRVKKVIEYAIEESRNLGHDYVGSEHLLLGLIRDGDGVATQILLNLKLTLQQLRIETIKLLSEHSDDATAQSKAPRNQKFSFTQTIYRSFELAAAATEEAGQHTIGTGHMLIGLLRERDSEAAKVLTKVGLTEELVRKEMTGIEI